ncbi:MULTISPECIES: hypothetical protein [Burkholderia]|uniref:Conjugal transfer protein TraG n=1 Tax=Burkholderia contaminans TaxID=488447 RepID=A0A6P3C4P9_9BURK|nr:MULTISPECIES: hypothetical protein [Burkholderia]VWD62596.1 hypothetical protein BCO71033_06784 [Burkholderia contaminans]
MHDVSETLTQAWRVTVLTLAITIAIYAGLAAAEWLASCVLYASMHRNPIRAGWSTWLDALGAWYDGRLPNMGRRVLGAGLMGLLVAFGGPALAVYAWLEQAGRGPLYGDARFANEAEIRRAGLL